MNHHLEKFLRALSTVLGWTYVYCWSASFYPQPLLNWRRKSTAGLTVDFPALNVLGFVAYTISTTCFLFSPEIRKQYALRHPRAPEPTVRFNDFAFAVHALVMVILTYSQFYSYIWPFDVPKGQRTSIGARSIILASITAVILAIINASLNSDLDPTVAWSWIDVVRTNYLARGYADIMSQIYIFGHIKLLATLSKYMPQAWLNYKRRSTEGWSINQILFDFAGGILSLTQLLIDSSFQGDWSGITGNPAKFGLSNISLFFDIIFITQHYLLYRRPREEDSVNETSSLLREEAAVD